MSTLRKRKRKGQRKGERKGQPRGRNKLLVSQLGETGLVERILSGFSGEGTRGIIVGPGDDGAVIELDGRTRLVVTTDMLIENTHFRLEWSYPEAVGFKATVANLSDVGVMGGCPTGIVVSLGIPSAVPTRVVDGIYRGISKALSLFGGELLGGDTVRSRAVTVCISATGVLVGERPILRSGARPGDKICVTGSLGCSQMGLALLKKYFRTKRQSRSVSLLSWAERKGRCFREGLPASIRRDGYACISKHLMPKPRVREAGLLSTAGVSAMIDISDGLAADLIHIARASNVGLLLLEEKIPLCRNSRAVAATLGISPYEAALSSGEEYEILFTVPRARVKRAASTLAARCGTAVAVVGEITDRGKGVLIVDGCGERRELSATGFTHF